MKALRFRDFKTIVGQGFITMKTHNFPSRGWSEKTIGNDLYVWAKPDMVLSKLFELERNSGKRVSVCHVPKEIIRNTNI